MAKPRSCPHCLKVLDDETGYRFTAAFAMICDACGKDAFPTDYSAESTVDASIRSRSAPASNAAWTATSGLPAGTVKEYPPKSALAPYAYAKVE